MKNYNDTFNTEIPSQLFYQVVGRWYNHSQAENVRVIFDRV